MTPPALRGPARRNGAAWGKSLLRRHAGDVAVVVSTLAFVVVASVVGLWLVHAG